MHIHGIAVTKRRITCPLQPVQVLAGIETGAVGVGGAAGQRGRDAAIGVARTTLLAFQIASIEAHTGVARLAGFAVARIQAFDTATGGRVAQQTLAGA